MPKSKNAAEYLDQACVAETEGRQKTAEMALKLAIKHDDAEHAAGEGISLPRK